MGIMSCIRLASVLACGALITSSAIAQDAFYVGHSLTGPDSLYVLEKIGEEVRPSYSHNHQLIWGGPLKYNFEYAASLPPENRDSFSHGDSINSHDAIATGEYDTLVLTEANANQNHFIWNDTHLYAKQYADDALAAHPGARVYIFEAWPNLVESSEWMRDSWEEELFFDLYGDPAAGTLEERLNTQDLGLEGVADWVQENSDENATVFIIPGGLALQNVIRAVEAGRVPGLDDRWDLIYEVNPHTGDPDHVHPNPIGAYFMAMVTFATITGETPVGLPTLIPGRWGDIFVDVNPDTANALQRIAWRTVRRYPRSGVKTLPPPGTIDQSDGEQVDVIKARPHPGR